MRMRYVVIAGVLVVLGAALFLGVGFLAGRLFGEPRAAAILRPLGISEESEDAGRQSGGAVIVIDEGSGPVQITFSDPPEVPDRPPDAGGLFLRRQDNSVFVGTGSIEVSVEVINDEASVSASNDGPEVEVVVTGDTIIYEDVTEAPVIGPEDVEKGEMVVQRSVKQVSNLDGIEENMMVRAWGTRRGERVVADLLVYERVGLR